MNMPKITFIDQDTYLATPDNMFITTLDDVNITITNKIKAVSSSLGDLCNVNEGIHTGNLREKLVVSSIVDEFTYPLYRGENFERYNSNWDNLFIRYNWDIIKKRCGWPLRRSFSRAYTGRSDSPSSSDHGHGAAGILVNGVGGASRES